LEPREQGPSNGSDLAIQLNEWRFGEGSDVSLRTDEEASNEKEEASGEARAVSAEEAEDAYA
jgi:hypothetical protein